jgi:hypothetical protein
MNELSTTAHGRLLSAAMALALIGGGAAAVLQNGMSQALMSLAILLGGTLGIVAVALSIEEHKTPMFTVFAVISLPVALFLYVVGLGLSMKGAPWAGYCFMGLGLVFAGMAARGKRETALAPNHARAH